MKYLPENLETTTKNGKECLLTSFEWKFDNG